MSKNTKTIYQDDDTKKKKNDELNPLNTFKNNESEVPKKEVEDLINIVNEIKSRRTYKYYPSYYNNPPQKVQKTRARSTDIKDKTEAKAQYTNVEKDFSIRKLR